MVARLEIVTPLVAIAVTVNASAKLRRSNPCVEMTARALPTHELDLAVTADTDTHIVIPQLLPPIRTVLDASTARKRTPITVTLEAPVPA